MRSAHRGTLAKIASEESLHPLFFINKEGGGEGLILVGLVIN